MKVHICGSIGTGWGSYVKNLLGSMNSDVDYTYPSWWTSYWQFRNTSLNGTPTKSRRIPVSGIIARTRLPRVLRGEFPRIEFIQTDADLIHANCRLIAGASPYILVFDTPMLLSTYRTSQSYSSVGKIICKHVALNKCRKILPFSIAAKAGFMRMSGLSDSESLIEVLPPGIRIPSQRAKPEKIDDDVRLLFVGRNFQRKGGDLLIRSFVKLCSEYSNIRLIIKTGRQGISIPPQLADKITLIDYEIPQDQLDNLYHSSDIFVLPTLEEAYGLACAEAMSYGLPPVVSKHYALTEIVDDEATGLLFETGNATDLTIKLRTLISDSMLRKRLGESAMHKAKLKFSNDVVNARLQEIYSNMIG